MLDPTTAGVYTSPIDGRDYPRIQILTIHELLDEGRKPMLPRSSSPPTSRPSVSPTRRPPSNRRCSVASAASPHFCSQCGHPVAGDQRFCPNCGTALSPAISAETTAPSIPSGRLWTPATLAMLVAGVAIAVGPFLPFISATAALVGNITRSGVELSGLEGFLLVGLGAALAIRAYQRTDGKHESRGSRIAPAIISAAVLLSAWYYYGVLDDRVTEINASEVGFGSIGIGLWMVIAGGLVGFAANFASPPRHASDA